MGAHTKGPWNVCAYGRFPGINAAGGTSIVVYGDGSDEYMGIRGTEPHEPADEVAANARLIASAPDFFAACVPSDLEDAADIVEAENSFLASELRKQATAQRAAIARATGEAS